MDAINHDNKLEYNNNIHHKMCNASLRNDLYNSEEVHKFVDKCKELNKQAKFMIKEIESGRELELFNSIGADLKLYPKFNIGENVYIVYSHSAYLKNIANCKMCNGFRRIKIRGLSDPINCPQCSIFDSSRSISYTMYEYGGSSTIKDIYIHIDEHGKTDIRYNLNIERSRSYGEHELFSNYDELIKYTREKTRESREKAEKLYSEFEALPEVYSKNDLIEYCVINKNKEGETNELL